MADRGAPLPPSRSSILGRWWWQGAGGRSRWCYVQRRTVTKPVGDWKPAQNPRVPHSMWEGVGYPCISCFRMWGVTDGHTDTEGPAGGVPPAAAPGPPASRGSPSLQHAAVDGDDGDGDGGAAAFPFRPLLDRDEPGPMPDTSVDDDDLGPGTSGRPVRTSDVD
ncbi:hypothetical protein CYMTET_11538 [Cymbomonas tetramitiformis]|uniref:Uncharacterized protein n=1 Tax=Cymbomonas tetramitiformis TaxID=36881 RepID=A0AAE0GNG7_9CHLO|nr:hypothetical protein CYMTET_11538 [Cymbomonas tetramitiformis]